MSDKEIDSWVHWEQDEVERGTEVLALLEGALPDHFGGSTLILSSSSDLSFYEDHRLVELAVLRENTMEHVFVLAGPHGVVWLNGDSAPIHIVNDAEELRLTPEVVTDYLRFFLYFLRSDGSAFVPVETPEEVTPGVGSEEPSNPAAGAGGGSGGDDQGDTGDGGDEGALSLEAARNCARPLELEPGGGDGPWRFNATLAYQGGLFLASFAVEPNGEVEMVDDDPVGALGDLRTPEVPTLDLPVRTGLRPDDGRSVPLARAATGIGDEPRDREVTEAVVGVLLEEAIRTLLRKSEPGSVALRHFNSETQSGKPIEQLTKWSVDSKPIVIIESDIPFVEDFVAALVANGDMPSQHAVRAVPPRATT